ncbi:preprotein translocase subunit YajC [Pelistega indica]|uniref:Sec translocon accessory complex subunit YajC n=1 Tax=Pelistega indica TaxID=1414851 RepID=V8FYK5_9BURK|nr:MULTISPECIES: preprotein translocase subunit YajC [Pelistega]ETD68497.1 preprotein translocase subunit YajC [Pelistega indica]
MLLNDLIQLSLGQAADAGAGGTLAGLLPIILMFVVLYFLMIRPQMKRQKEHRALVEGLKKGDEVITAGGLLGKVSRVTDNYIAIEVAQQNGQSVEILCQRVAVTTVLPTGTIKDL